MGFPFLIGKKPSKAASSAEHSCCHQPRRSHGKMPRDGTSHCQVLVQNSYIRTVTNTRPIPSDSSKQQEQTKQQEPFPGQAQRAQQLPGCCLLLLAAKGCFPYTAHPGLLSTDDLGSKVNTLTRWLSLSTIVATLIKMGFRLSTASNFVLTWNP